MSNDQATYFSCNKPWSSCTITPSGDYFTCAEASSDINNKLNTHVDETIETIWNSEKLNEVRKAFQNHTIPLQCKSCFLKEFQNGKSLRIISNLQAPLITNITRPVLKKLEIALSNLCNLKCHYCSSFYSNRLYHRDLQNKLPVPDKVILKRPQPLKMIQAILDDLESIEFSGGEPLIQAEHDVIIDYLIVEKKTNIKISYLTNFNIDLRTKKYLILSWKNFNSIVFNISLDDLGPKGEAIRVGLDTELVFQNLELIKKELPQAKIKLICTVSILNIFNLTNFLNILKDYNISLNLLERPSHLSINNLTNQLKKICLKEIKKFQLSLTDGNFSIKNQSLFIELAHVVAKIQMPSFAKEQETFKIFLKSESKTISKQSFPELAEFF